MRKAYEKPQYNIKISAEAMEALQKVQGYGMIKGIRDSQADIIERVLKEELARIEGRAEQEKVLA